MKARLAWLVGGIGVAGIAAYRALRREPATAPPPAAADPAEQLRQKLAESRSIVEEREEFESAETTVDHVEAKPAKPAEPDPEPELEPELEKRRKRVHERGKAAARKMRPPANES